MTPLLSSGLLRAQTDDRLVELAAAGHDRAFEAIVERYRRPLLRYLRRLLSDALAEDVVQATFINAWSSLRTGTEVRDLRPWLYRIAHNAAINALKRVGEAMEEVPESAGGFATEPAAELERRDEMHRALTSIAALPSRQRAALLAVAVDGRAHSDVAAELGLTDGAVRQLVHRARTTLRGGATAITPMPLLHMLMTSAGDSTVARVAEVAAGAGGAGAASVSLKAGAAAVLATGAIVTGGPEIADVVHPSQRAVAPEARAPAPPAASTGSASAAAPLVAPRLVKDPPSSTSSTSGRSHKQRRRGRNGGSKAGATGAKRERGSNGRRGTGSAGTRTTSSGRQGSTSSGGGNAGASGSGSGSSTGQQSVTSGKHGAASGSNEGSGGGGGNEGDGGGTDDAGDLVVTPPTTTATDQGEQSGSSDSGGGGSSGGGDTGPATPRTAPPPTVAPVPTTPTGTSGSSVPTEPSGGGSGGSGGEG